MLKKSICIVLSFIFVFSLLSFQTAAGSEKEKSFPFTDVVKGKWYYDAISKVFDEGIMNGKSETEFMPSSPMTRAELVTTLARIACINTEGYEDKLDFSDTKQSAWYAPYVGWAAENGIVNGYNDGTFRPNASINRQELAALFVRFIDFMEATPEIKAGKRFGDEAKIQSWALEYVNRLRDTGLVVGDNKGNFNPKSTATRAEIATIVVRLIPSTSRMDIAVDSECGFYIAADTENEEIKDAAERLSWQISEVCGASAEIKNEYKEGDRCIILSLDDTSPEKDGYTISVDGKMIKVSSKEGEGLYRGAVRLVNGYSKDGNLRMSAKSGETVLFEYPVGKITVNGKDISEYTIYYPEGAGENLIYAANNFSSYIEKACGAKLPVKSGTGDGYAFILNVTPIPDGESFDDSFSIKTSGNSVMISGSENRGIYNGIYDFLEQEIGWRYLDDERDYIERKDEIKIENPDYSENAVFKYHVMAYADLDEGYLRNQETLKNKAYRAPLWATRDCHTFDDLDGDYSTQGGSQPCLTSDEVYEYILANVRKCIEDFIEENGCVPDMISLSQNDNSNYCKCESCAASDEYYGEPSGTLIAFVNKMTRELVKDYPNLMVHTFAYLYTEKAPKNITVDDHVTVQFCPLGACYTHFINDPKCIYNDTTGKKIDDWSKIAEHISIWNYGFFWTNPAWSFGSLSYHNTAENMRFYADRGTNYIFNNLDGNKSAEFERVRYYLVNKLLWDPYLSEEEFYDFERDACLGYYGPGGDLVYEALRLKEDKYSSCLGGADDTPENIPTVLRKKNLDTIISLMDKARVMTETKSQWDEVDCSLLQFEMASLDLEFNKLMKSSDKEDVDRAQETSRYIYGRILKYNNKITLSYPNPEDIEYFNYKPSFWKTMIFEHLGVD